MAHPLDGAGYDDPDPIVHPERRVALNGLKGVSASKFRDNPIDIPEAIRAFETGATRNVDNNKFDYEGFLNPEVLHIFAEYMHAHRRQKDGSLRDSDNWQKGMPLQVYAKSLVRHVIDLWRMHRGYQVTNPDTGQPHTIRELCCAILFNVMGYLKESETA